VRNRDRFAGIIAFCHVAEAAHRSTHSTRGPLYLIDQFSIDCIFDVGANINQ